MSSLGLLPACMMVAGMGCTTATPPPVKAVAPEYRPIGQGSIGTSGVVITAEDGSFVLKADDLVWQSPFQSNCWCREMGAAWPPNDKLIDAYRIAMKNGARLVRVDVPSRRTPLYGILMLCKAHPGASGPAARTYRIELDPDYVEKASGGVMSAMYELMNYTYDSRTQLKWYSWILWLSEEPIPLQ